MNQTLPPRKQGLLKQTEEKRKSYTIDQPESIVIVIGFHFGYIYIYILFLTKVEFPLNSPGILSSSYADLKPNILLYLRPLVLGTLWTTWVAGHLVKHSPTGGWECSSYKHIYHTNSGSNKALTLTQPGSRGRNAAAVSTLGTLNSHPLIAGLSVNANAR